MSYIQMCPEQYLECYTKSDQCCLIILNEEESYITIKITRNHFVIGLVKNLFSIYLWRFCVMHMGYMHIL